jgi:hypothetical protein
MLVRTSLYRTFLIVLAILLVAALVSCAAGSKEKGGKGESDTTRNVGGVTPWKLNRQMRLLLGGSQAADSARAVSELFMDQALRQAADSIPVLEYLTLNNRDSLAGLAVRAGKQGVDIADLGKQLGVDGVIFTRLERFSSVLAMELRIIDPLTRKLLFRDLEFSLIRFRDSSGALLLGPALFDLARKGLGKYAGEVHLRGAPIATEPLIVTGIEIDTPALGRLYTNRETASEAGVRAVGEFARINYPELIAFDFQSRNQLYKSLNVGAVTNYLPINDLERRALFNIGIERYAAAVVRPEGEALKVRLELRSIISPTRDSVVSASDTTLPGRAFETTTMEHDLIETLLRLAEPVFTAEADRLKSEYQKSFAGGKP